MHFTHLLVPMDFSEPSKHGLRLAIKMARHGRARLTVVHVIPPQAAVFTVDIPGWAALDPGLLERYQQELEGSARHQLEAVIREEIPEDVPCTSVVMTGTVAACVVEEARARSADLIVMGTTGRTGLPHLLLGSVAERVMAEAPVPVLVTH